jgi:hypothetical protein
MNQPISIYASKKSEKIIVTCTGVYMLLRYCSFRQAKKMARAAQHGQLWGAYFTKSGNVRANYIG